MLKNLTYYSDNWRKQFYKAQVRVEDSPCSHAMSQLACQPWVCRKIGLTGSWFVVSWYWVAFGLTNSIDEHGEAP